MNNTTKSLGSYNTSKSLGDHTFTNNTLTVVPLTEEQKADLVLAFQSERIKQQLPHRDVLIKEKPPVTTLPQITLGFQTAGTLSPQAKLSIP